MNERRHCWLVRTREGTGTGTDINIDWVGIVVGSWCCWGGPRWWCLVWLGDLSSDKQKVLQLIVLQGQGLVWFGPWFILALDSVLSLILSLRRGNIEMSL